MSSISEVLFHASEEHEEDSLLDVLVSVNRRGERVGQDVEGGLSLGNLLDVFNVGVCDSRLSDSVACLASKCRDVVGKDDSST